jgi:hypothetical protein
VAGAACKEWNGATAGKWLEIRVIAARSDQVTAERGGRGRQDDCDRAIAEEMVCSLLQRKGSTDTQKSFSDDLRALLDRDEYVWRGVYDDARFDRQVRSLVKKLIRMTRPTKGSRTPRITNKGKTSDDPIRWEGSVGIRSRLRSGSVRPDGNAAMPTPPPDRRPLCADRLCGMGQNEGVLSPGMTDILGGPE